MFVSERKDCSLCKKKRQCKTFRRMLGIKQCLTRHLGLFHYLSMTNLFLTTQYWAIDQKDYAILISVKITEQSSQPHISHHPQPTFL